MCRSLGVWVLWVQEFGVLGQVLGCKSEGEGRDLVKVYRGSEIGVGVEGSLNPRPLIV